MKRWWKQLRAKLSNYAQEYEWGGVLFDYKNGELEELCRWEDDKGMFDSWTLVENMSYAGRDTIFVAMVRVGKGQGYFVIHDSNLTWWECQFHPEHYDFHQAYRETMGKCRELANGMGFRDPKDVGK